MAHYIVWGLLAVDIVLVIVELLLEIQGVRMFACFLPLTVGERKKMSERKKEERERKKEERERERRTSVTRVVSFHCF